MSEEKTLLEQFSAFATSLSLEDIDPSVISRLKLYVLDQIGVEIAGSGLPRTLMVREYAKQFGKPGVAKVIGTDLAFDAESAAMVNATAGHGLEFDDFNSRTPCHPGCVVVPAVLGIGDETESVGRELLVAAALGFEMVTRISLSATPSLLYGRGFHETCAQGVFGSTIVTDRLTGLSIDDTVMSLGLAASHASGIDEFTETGGEVKRLHAGMGAAGGIRCSRLAKLGMTAPRTALEGRKGFFHSFSDGPVPSFMVDGLGETWQLQLTLLREFPVGGRIIPSIRSLLGIMKDEGLKAEDIASIQVGIDHGAISRHGSLGAQPKDLISAQFSAHFILALAAVKGTIRFSDYLALEKVGFHEPEIERIAQNVSLVLDEAADKAYPGRFEQPVTVRTTDGREWTRRQGITAGDPPDETFIRNKFMTIATERFSEDRARQIMDTIDELEKLQNARDLTALLVD